MKQTLADTAYKKLLDMIYSLKYQSGDRLVEQQLINELEISRTPVREALIELAKTKIIDVQPQCGWRVGLIDHDLVTESRLLRMVLEKLVVERLIAGPDAENEELYPVINPATKVLGVTVKDGTCYVNLDNGFLTQTYNVSAEVQIYSIVNSLVELSNINKVQIAVNGNTDMIFREKISLSNVFDRNLDLVYETEELQS